MKKNKKSSIVDVSEYINIPLPKELAKQIEEVIQKANMGYKTKTEFIKEAVREKLMAFAKFQEAQKVKFSGNRKSKIK